MKKQEVREEINSLNKLLKSKFPSSLTRRIELDDQFFTEVQQFAGEVLDFSYYSELEQIVSTSKIQGIIKKIDISKNENLVELNFPNQKLVRLNLSNNKKLITLDVSNNQLTGLNLDQNYQLEHINVAQNEITGVWDIKKCSKIKFLDCQNNYLNGLRVHEDLRYLFLSSNPSLLQPQKHNKEKVNPLKDIAYIKSLALAELKDDHAEENNKTKSSIQQEKQFQPGKLEKSSWKNFYRWLQTEVVENDNLRIKLKTSQRVNYPNVSEDSLNHFVNSLESTLDNDNFFHLFSTYDRNKSFEELFNINLIFCGKKTEKKRIDEVSYKDLKKLFCDWKASLRISQEEVNKSEENQSKHEREELKIFQATRDKVRNILLIGRTGSGKSTLANVLINKNEEFEEVFKVSARSVSETKNVKAEKFTVDISNDGKEYIDYLVIDTIGFGDTKISDKEVLQLLQDLVPIIGDNGINQIFFVTDGRFTEKEIETYKLLETVIFDKKVVDFTTIVRVRFPEFEDREECDEDRKALRKENEEIFKILKTSKIVYVDNPPLAGRSLVKNKEIREESRKRLLTHLGTCQDIYFPSNLAEFKQRIDDYQTKTEQLEKELERNEQIIKEQEDKFQSDIQAAQTKQRIDSELSQRKFNQKIKVAKDGYEWKLKYTQEQLEIKYQNQLKSSQEKYEREQNEAELRRQYEVNRIRSEFQDKKVQVGEAVCSQDHNNVQAYNKHGTRPDPDDFNDTIFFVWCSVCGKIDYNCKIRNAATYNFEEWCKMRNQSYAQEIEKMNWLIQGEEKRKREIIARIHQERRDRDAAFQRELEQQKQLKEQEISKQREIDEERLKRDKLSSVDKITSGSQAKINKLNRELNEIKQKLENQIRQSQIRKDISRQNLDAYVEQLLTPNYQNRK